jgi:hypothetical protein
VIDYKQRKEVGEIHVECKGVKVGVEQKGERQGEEVRSGRNRELWGIDKASEMKQMLREAESRRHDCRRNRRMMAVERVLCKGERQIESVYVQDENRMVLHLFLPLPRHVENKLRDHSVAHRTWSVCNKGC